MYFILSCYCTGCANLQESHKGGRILSAARIKDVVALKPGAPLGQDRNQPAVSDIFIRNIFRKAGYAQPIESSIKLMYRAVCNILPLHLQAELLVFLLEFPGIQTTRGGIPNVDAVMVQQILRFFGLPIALKIIRCCNNQLPPVLTDFNGNHIVIQRISGADPCVKTLTDDVGKSIINADFNLNIGVAA